MSVQYICNGALVKCSCGSAMSKLQVLPDRTVTLAKENYGNISDHDSMINIKPFGLCNSLKYPPTKSATSANHGSLTPMPCKPGTMTLWENGNESYLIRKFPALQSTSFCRCIYGGIITIVNDGQLPSQYELKKSNALQEETLFVNTDKVNDDKAIDAVDFIPLVGSLRDIKTGLATGSMGMVAMGGAFLVLDIAGLATLGAGTVGSIALKTSVKAGLKTTAKATIRTTTKEVVKHSEKKLLELTAKDATNNIIKPELGQLAKKKASELLVEDLGKAATKNASSNIFKINSRIAETGAKETTKTTKFERQIKVIIDNTSECVEKMTQQINEVAKIGKEWLGHGFSQLKKDLKPNIELFDKFKKIDSLKKEINRLEKIYKPIKK